MAILGRVLQVIGWLWMAASVFGRLIDLPELPEFSFFPGLILVFVSRVLRTQNRRRQPVEDATGEVPPKSGAPVPRPLNTERSKEPQRAVSAPAAKTKPKPPPSAGSEVVWPKNEPAQTSERQDPIEQILVAGSDLEREKVAEIPTLEPSHDGEQLTSAEMIARARQRWDRKP